MRGPGFRRVPAPEYPTQGNAGQHYKIDARPFKPGQDVDIKSANDTWRRLIEDGIVNVSDIIDRLTANNKPPQLVQAGFPALITAQGITNKILLIPKNPFRQSVKICNPSAIGNITFSYDSPILLAGVGMGVPVPATNLYEESNGSVSINAIWVWSDSSTAVYPIPVIGYEGVLSIVGNKP